MTVSSTSTRSCRIGSETSLSGSEVVTASTGTLINHVTAAATDDDAFTLTIERADLETLYFQSDIDVFLRLISETPRPDFTVAGPPGEMTLLGDYTFIKTQSQFAVSGATTAGNNGVYIVDNIVFAAGVSTITTVEAVANVEAGAAGTAITFVKPDEELDYAITAVGAGAGGTYTVAGDVSAWNDYDQRFIITGSTNNDTVWSIDTAVFGGVNTVITVVAGETVLAVADGDIIHVDVDKWMPMVATVPFLWTAGGNIDNALITNVTGGEVTNESATLASDLVGRVVTS